MVAARLITSTIPRHSSAAGEIGLYASGQLARHYRLPWRSRGGALTTSPIPDAQAALEGTNTMLAAFLSGANLVLHTGGWLETGVTPVIDQIESHPGFTQDALRRELARRGILVQAYSPLGSTTPRFHESAIGAIAETHGRSPAQIVPRWHVDLGSVPIPKSSHPERMAENLALFDFEQTEAERSTLAGLERGHRLGGDPATEEG